MLHYNLIIIIIISSINTVIITYSVINELGNVRDDESTVSSFSDKIEQLEGTLVVSEW